MEIGKKIKELRKRDHVTQDRLACALNLSYQAISKWENGTTSPDIKLLVPIANFFNVSVDDLLGRSGIESSKEIEIILKKVQVLNQKGNIYDSITLLREKLEIYPKSYKLMYELARNLIYIMDEKNLYNQEENGKEAIEICNLIMEECTDKTILEKTENTLFFANLDVKNFKEAERLAMARPSIHSSKEIMLSFTYQGRKAGEHIQTLIMQLSHNLIMNIPSLHFERNGGSKYSNEEKAQIINKTINLINILIDDENYLYVHVDLARLYKWLARIYSHLDKSKMYETLLKSKYHANEFDNLSKEDAKYTALLFRDVVYEHSKVIVNTELTQLDGFYDELERDVYKSFRQEERFKKLSSR